MNIYIANIPFRTKELELQQLFENYGTVEKAKIVTDRETGKSRGFGFIEMPDDEEARKAIAALHDSNFGERKLVVNQARDPKS